MSIEERLQRIENGEPVENEYETYRIKEKRCQALSSVMFRDHVNLDVTKRRLAILMDMNDKELTELEKLYDLYSLEDETCKSHQK